MSIGKNKGPKLYFSQFGGEQPIPPEFIAAMDRSEEVQPVPNDVGPEVLSDTIIESGVKTDRTDERVRRTIKKKAGNIILRAIHTDDSGAPVQVTRTLFPTGTTPTVPTATTKVAVQDLGNGWSIQEVAVEGSYDGGGNFVPGIFTADLFSKEVPDVVPEEFRVAVPTQTTRADSAGTAAAPTLGSGDLFRSEEQTSTFIKRVLRRFRSLVGLPVSLVGKQTDQQKQIVTVTQTLKTAGSDATPTALKDVEVQNLGDGTVLQTQKDISAVFQEKTRQIGTPLVIPERFRAATGVNTKSDIVSGTVADSVSLDAGEVERQETERTVFTKQVRTTSFTPGAAPTLHGQEYERETDIVIPFEERLEASGTSLGVARTTVDPLSDQLDLARTVDITGAAAVFNAYQVVFPGTADISLPHVLISVQVEMNTSQEIGQYNESGSGFFSGLNGSISLSVHGSGEGSVGLSPALAITTYEPNGRNIPTLRCMFLLPQPVTNAQVLSKLSSVLGVSVTAWPVFKPMGHTIVLKGQHLSLRADARGESHTSFTVANPGSGFVNFGQAQTTGRGGSRRGELSNTTVTIPPTIHGGLSFGLGASQATTTAVATADISAGQNFLGAHAQQSLNGTVQASVSPGSLGATIGATSIPTSGYRLLDVRGQLYKYGYVLFHAEVVDFSFFA